VPAELNGSAQGIEKDFAIRAITEVDADLPADVAGQFIVQIGGEPFENLHAMSFAVVLVLGRLAGAGICSYSVGHEGPAA